jgi:hypothetical protein
VETDAGPDIGETVIYHGILGVRWLCRIRGGLRDGRAYFGQPEQLLRIAAPVEAFRRCTTDEAAWEVDGVDCDVTDEATD